MQLEEIKKVKHADLAQMYFDLLKKHNAGVEELRKEVAADYTQIKAEADRASQLDKDIEALKEDNTSLLEEKLDFETQIKNQNEIIAGLNQRVLELDAAVDHTKVTVEHQGKKFEVLYSRLKHNGEFINAEDLKNFPEVIAELVEMKSGALKPV